MLGQPWNPPNTAPHPMMPALLTVPINVVLHEVNDLTDVGAAQTPLQTNAQELTGDWDCYGYRSAKTVVSAPVGISPTQELGMELFLAGIEGFWAISAKAPYQRNLVIFPQNLQARSSIVLPDPHHPNGPPLARIP